MNQITNITLRPFCGIMILEIQRNTRGGQVDVYNVSHRMERAKRLLDVAWWKHGIPVKEVMR